MHFKRVGKNIRNCADHEHCAMPFMANANVGCIDPGFQPRFFLWEDIGRWVPKICSNPPTMNNPALNHREIFPVWEDPYALAERSSPLSLCSPENLPLQFRRVAR